jgi:uncharacterized protein YceH (UPF0502 family)/protein-L-isoaspartate O-methyltransferase
MDLDERTVEAGARGLRERGLIRVVWADTGRRTLKYHQTLVDAVVLDEAERALVTVLLLRGAQTPGELKARTERLHAFADREAVEGCLRGLAARAVPVVRELERRPGQQDRRWAHLFGPEPEPSAGPAPDAAPAVDREAPIADGADARDGRVRTSYATVAADYALNLAGELADLPFERWLLDRAVREAAGRPVVDAGCGPGHVTAYLAAAGADAVGLDLTPAMVEQARRRFPDVRYEVGDLRALVRPPSAAGWGAVLGWYSLIHLAGSELPAAVVALARPLAPGGVLVLGLHAGNVVRRITTWFDHDVRLDWYRRGPLEARGETTQRLYVLARRPGPS